MTRRFPKVGANKFDLVSNLVDTLFKPEHRRLYKLLAELNIENKRIHQRTYDGFIFRGKFYMPLTEEGGSLTYPSRGDPKTPMHFSLCKRMEFWLKDRETIWKDEKETRQALFILLEPCKTQQEIRDALPECLVLIDEHLSKYPRTRESAYTLEENDRGRRQYEKILPKIEIYSVTRLIF